MKRKCINCKHYDNGYRNYGENGYDFENASCRLGIKNANYFDDNEEKDCSCTLSQKEFDLRTKLADIEDANYYNGWEVQGLKEDIEHYKEQIQQLKSEQNKVAVEKLGELEKYLYTYFNGTTRTGAGVFAKINSMIKELKG